MTGYLGLVFSTRAVKSRSSSNPMVQVGAATGKLGFPSSGHAHITRVSSRGWYYRLKKLNENHEHSREHQKLLNYYYYIGNCGLSSRAASMRSCKP